MTTVALWRSRAVPRWLPVLFVVGVVLAALAPAGIVSIPVQLPITVTLIALAIRVWRTQLRLTVCLRRPTERIGR